MGWRPHLRRRLDAGLLIIEFPASTSSATTPRTAECRYMTAVKAYGPRGVLDGDEFLFVLFWVPIRYPKQDE